MGSLPDVHALCTDQVKPNADGHKDIRASLSFMTQLRVAALKEYSTLTTELFATPKRQPDRRPRVKDEPYLK